MSDAYAQGIHHAWTALAWAAGVLTVLAYIALVALVTAWTGRHIPAKVRLIHTKRRLLREHARSGRA